jgi:hypothetical protein
MPLYGAPAILGYRHMTLWLNAVLNAPTGEWSASFVVSMYFYWVSWM